VLDVTGVLDREARGLGLPPLRPVRQGDRMEPVRLIPYAGEVYRNHNSVLVP